MLTATIPHPTFATPSGSFGIVVRKLGRVEAMKTRAAAANRERPFPLPDGGVAWRAPEGDAFFWLEQLAFIAKGFVNPPNGEDGKPLTFSRDNLLLLFDEQYDVKEEFEGKPVSLSFPMYVLREYARPETFPDPTAAPSATS